MDRFTAFVIEHGNDDPAELVLGRERWPEIDVALAADTVAGRRRMRSKAPSWYARPDLIYPSRLCVEQCSSEAACRIKTEILLDSLAGCSGGAGRETEDSDAAVGTWLRIADLTGGLGMDSYAFSQICSQVLYVEMDCTLADAARHNFTALGCSNIEVLNAEVTPQGLDGKGWEAVRRFAPDLIYLDPARRGDTGQKVFKLEDCRPDILQLKDVLLTLAPTVMVKLSPMADIDMVLRQLGPRCSRLDVISVDNECKELLVTLVRASLSQLPEEDTTGDHSDRLSTLWQEIECEIVADCSRANSFIFTRSEESAAVPAVLSDPVTNMDRISVPDGQTFHDSASLSAALTGKTLLEPDKALMKAAPFRLLSTRLGLTKLDVSTHYYICDAATPNDLFRKFRILRVEPLNNRTLKSLGKDFPQAEVTARNIPLSSDELRRRLGAGRKADSSKTSETEDRSTSNAIHIFGLRAADIPLLLVTERLF